MVYRTTIKSADFFFLDPDVRFIFSSIVQYSHNIIRTQIQYTLDSIVQYDNKSYI